MKKIIVTGILTILCILTISACGNAAAIDNNIAGEVLFGNDSKADAEDSWQKNLGLSN